MYFVGPAFWMHTCLKQNKPQIEIHLPRIFMGGKLNLLLLGSSLGRENNGHSPLVWPSAKSFKKKREKERETIKSVGECLGQLEPLLVGM